ncbi:UNVERIFIED_CONTAM: glutamic acid-rcih protein, putative [Hammondia hammondi]|eukprot:XP_008886959.1 glutamic acid-rcih protein, putative [Hammondia hammondi]
MARGTTASSLDATRLEESGEEVPPGDAEGEEDVSLLRTSFPQAEGAAVDERAGLSHAESTRNVRKKNASSSSSPSSSATSSSPEEAKTVMAASSLSFSYSPLGASKLQSLPLVKRSEVDGESSCFRSVFLSSLGLLCPSSTSLLSPFACESLVAPYRSSPVSACFLLSQDASRPPLPPLSSLCPSSRPAAPPDPRGKSPSLLLTAVPAYLLALRQLQRLLARRLLNFSSSSSCSSVPTSPSACAAPAVCSLHWRRAFRRLVLLIREGEASVGEKGSCDLLSLPLRPWQTEWRRARYAACVSAYAVFQALAAEREREAQRISERGREESRERRASGAEETDRGDELLGALYDAALHALRAKDRHGAEEGEAEQTDSEEWGEDLTSIPIEDGVDFDGEETGLPPAPTRRDTELASLLPLLEEFRETAQQLSIAFCKAKRTKQTHPTCLSSSPSSSSSSLSSSTPSSSSSSPSSSSASPCVSSSSSSAASSVVRRSPVLSVCSFSQSLLSAEDLLVSVGCHVAQTGIEFLECIRAPRRASASRASAGLHEDAEELRSDTARDGTREAKPRSALPPPVPFGSFGRKQRISEGSGWGKPSPQSLAVVDWQLHLPRGALARALLACPRCSQKQSTHACSEREGACSGKKTGSGCGDRPPRCCLLGRAGAALWGSLASQGGGPAGGDSESREDGEQHEEQHEEQEEEEEEQGEGAEGKGGDGGVSVRLVLHLDPNALGSTASEARVEKEEEETMSLLHALVGDLLQRAVWTMKKSEVSVFFVPLPGLSGLESSVQQGNSADASLSAFPLSSKLYQVHAPTCVPLVFSLRLLDFQPLFPSLSSLSSLSSFSALSSLSSLSPSVSSSRKEEGGRGVRAEVQQIAGLVLEASRRSRSLLQIAEEFQSFCSIIFHLLLERDPRARRLLLSLILSSRGDSSETRVLSGLPAEDATEIRDLRSVVRNIFPTQAEERLVLSLVGSELEKTKPEKTTQMHAVPSPPDLAQTPPPSPASQKRSRWWHPGALRSGSQPRRLLSLLSSSSVRHASPASRVFCREDSRELEQSACARSASKQSVDESSSEVKAHAGAEETLQGAWSHLRGRAQAKKAGTPSPLLLGHLETEVSACDDNSLPATPSLCAASACESEARRQRENTAKAEGERESKRRFAGLRTTIKSPLWRRRASPLPSTPGARSPHQTSGEQRGGGDDEEERVGGEEAGREGTTCRTTAEDVFRAEGNVEEGPFFSVPRRGDLEFEAGCSAGLWGGARSALPSLADLASLQKQLYAHHVLEVQGTNGRRETADEEDAETLARSLDSVFEKGVVIQGVYFQVIESEEVWRHLHRERQVARAGLFRFQHFACPPLFLLLEMSARRLFASPLSELALLPCLRRSSGVSSSSTWVGCEEALLPHPLSRMCAPNPRPRRPCGEFPAKEEQEREGDGEEEDVSLLLRISGGWSVSERPGVPSLPSLFPLVPSCVPSFSAAHTLESSSPRRSLSRRLFSRAAPAPLKAEAPPFLVVDPEADSERQVVHARKVAVEAPEGEEQQGLLLSFSSEELCPAVVQWRMAGAVDSEDREGGGGGRREKKEQEVSFFLSKEEETAALQAASQALGLSGNGVVLSPLRESSSLDTCPRAASWLPSFLPAAAATDSFPSSGVSRHRRQVRTDADESAAVARRTARSAAGNLWKVAGQLCRVWFLSGKGATVSERRGEEIAEGGEKQGRGVSSAEASRKNNRSPLFGLLLLPLRLASSWTVRPNAFDFDALPLAVAEETRRGGRGEERFPWVAPSSKRREAASSEVQEVEGEGNAAKRGEEPQPLDGAGEAPKAFLEAGPSFCLVGSANCLRGDTSQSVRKVGSFLLSEVSGHLGHPQGLRAILHAKFLPVSLAEWLLLADLFLAFPENRSQSDVPERSREKCLREETRKGRQTSGRGRAGDAAQTRRSRGEEGAERDEEADETEQEGGEEELEEEGSEEGEGREEDEREKEENEREEFRCSVRRREDRARELFALIAADLLGSAVKRALRHLSPSVSEFSTLVGAATGWLFSGNRDAPASSSAVQAGVSLSLAFQFLRVTVLFPSLRGRFSPLLPLAVASQSSPVFLRRSLAYHLGLAIPAFTDPPSSSLSSLSSSPASSGYGAARKRRIWSHLEGRGGENVQWRCARLSQVLRGGDWSETAKAGDNKRAPETSQETVWGFAGETRLGAEVPAPREQRVWVRMRLKPLLEAEDVACLSLSLGQLALDTLLSSSEAQDWPGHAGSGVGSRDDAAKERQKRPSHDFQVPSLLSLLQHDVALAASCAELAVPSSLTFAAFLTRHPPSSMCLPASPSLVSREVRKGREGLVETREHSSGRREDAREASEDVEESMQIPILRKAVADTLPRRLRATVVSQVLLRSLLGEERRRRRAAEANEQTERKGEKKSGSFARVVVKLGATPGGLADIADRHLLHLLLHAVVEFDCWRGFLFEKEGGNSSEGSCLSSSSSSSVKSDTPLRGTEKRRQELVFVSLVSSVENLQVSVHHSLELQIVLLLVQGLNRLQRGFLASSRLRLMKAADLFESLWGPVSWEGLLSSSASLPVSSDAKAPARKETQTCFSSAHPLMLFPVWLLLLLSYCGAVSSAVSSSGASTDSQSQEEKSKCGGVSSPSFILSLPRGVPQGDFLTACVAVYADLLRLLRLRCPTCPLPAGPPHLVPSSLPFSPHLTIDRRCLVSSPFPSAPERLRPVTNIFSDENATERKPLESLSGLSAAPHAPQMPQDAPSEAFRLFGCTYTPKFPRKEHCRIPVEAILSAQQISAILCFNLRRCQPHLSRWLASASLSSPRGDVAVSAATEVGCSFLAALLASPAPPPSPSLFESSRAVSLRKTKPVCMRRSTQRCLLPAVFLTASAPDSEASSLFSGGSEDARTRRDSDLSQIRDLRFLDDNEGHLERWWQTQKSRRVFACGSNERGALGVGRPAFYPFDPVLGEKENDVQVRRGTDVWWTPHPQRICSLPSDVKSVAGGAAHCVALTSSGCLYTWGANAAGQCGVSSPSQKTRRLRRHPADVVRGQSLDAIAAFSWVSFSDVSLPLKTGDEQAEGGEGVEEVESDAFLSLPVRLDVFEENETECLHSEKFRDVVSTSTLSLAKPFSPKVAFSLVACGADFSAAASAAGCLYTWGSNTCGVLGLGDTRSRGFPSLVSPAMFRSAAALHASSEGARATPSSPRVTAIACGNSHMGVLLEEGALYMWGSNWHAECGYCSLLEEKAVQEEVRGEKEVEEDDKRSQEEGSGEDLLYPREICVFELAPLRRDHHHVYEAVMHWMFINSNDEKQTVCSSASSSASSSSPVTGSGLAEASSWVQSGTRVARTRLGVKMNVCQTKKSFSVVLTPVLLPDLLRSVVAYTKDAASAQKLLNYRLRFSLLSCGSVHTLALGDTKASAEVAGGGERDRRSLQLGWQAEETVCEAGGERDEQEGRGGSQRYRDTEETLEKKGQKKREETVHTGFLYTWGRDSGNCLGLGRPPGASSNAYPSRIPALFFRVDRRGERKVERQGEENGERHEAQGHCEPLAFRRIAAGGTASGAIDDEHRLWLWGDVSGICPDFFPPPHRPECLSPSVFEVDSRLLRRSRQESVFDVSLCSSEKEPLEVALLHFPVEGTRLLLAPLAGGLVALGDGCGVQSSHQAVSAARSVSALRRQLAVDEWEDLCRRSKAGKRPQREDRQEEERKEKGEGCEKGEDGEREEKASDEERLDALRVPGAATVTPRFWVDKSRMERLRGIQHLVLPAGGRVDQVAGGTDFIVILSSTSQPGYSLSSSLCLPLLLSPPKAPQSSREVASRSGSVPPDAASPLARGSPFAGALGSNVGLQSLRASPVRVEGAVDAASAATAPSTSSFGPVASTALSAFISKLRVSPVSSPLARAESDLRPASQGLSLPALFGGFSLSTLVVPGPAVPASEPEEREKRETEAAEERDTTAGETKTGTEAERTTPSRRCSVESKAHMFSGETRGSQRERSPGGWEGARGVETKETGGTHASVSPRNDRMVALLEGLDKGSGRLFTLVNKVLQLPFSIPEERLDFHESPQQASDLQVSRSISSPRCASSCSPFASSMQSRPSGVTGASLFASETGPHAAAGQRDSFLPKTLRPASWAALESAAFSSVSATASASRAESAAEGAAFGSWAGLNSKPEPGTPTMNSGHSSLSHISWELAPEGASRKSSTESDTRGAQAFDSRDEGLSFSGVSAGRSSSSVSAGFASRFSEGRRDQAASFVSTAFPPAKQAERREEEWRKEEGRGQGRRRQLWMAQEPVRSAWVRPASFSSSLASQQNAGRVSGTYSFSTSVSAEPAGHRGFAFEPAGSTSPAAGTPAPAASFVFSSYHPPAFSQVACGEAKRKHSEVSSQETLWRDAGVERGLVFREPCLVQVQPAEVYRHLEPSQHGDSQWTPASTSKTSSEFLEPWRRVVHTAGSFASVPSQERRGVSDPFVAASGVRTLSGVGAARAFPRVAMPEGGLAGDASRQAGTLRGGSPALHVQARGFPELHAGARVWPSFSGGSEPALRGFSEPTPHLAYFSVSDAFGGNAAWAERAGEGRFVHAEIPNFRASQCAWHPATQTQTVGRHPPAFPVSGQPREEHGRDRGGGVAGEICIGR